jgi:hypothetical protein
MTYYKVCYKNNIDMDTITYNSETRTFTNWFKGLSNRMGARKGNSFAGRNRTAINTIGGAAAGTALARMRTRRQLERQGVQKGTDEYEQRMRRATAVGATAGAAAGFGADVAGRYRNAKAANIAGGMNNKAAAAAAKRQTVGGIFGNKQTRQSLTAKSNAQNGAARQMNKQNNQAQAMQRKMKNKGKTQEEIQAKLQKKGLTQQQINQGVTDKVNGTLQHSKYHDPSLQYKMGGKYGRTGKSVQVKSNQKTNPSQPNTPPPPTQQQQNPNPSQPSVTSRRPTHFSDIEEI